MTDEMTDEQKSIVLARLIGLEIGNDPLAGQVIKHPRGGWTSNLYHPQNMDLAWRALNWVSSQVQVDGPLDNRTAVSWIRHIDILWDSLWQSNGQLAQHEWLDKVLHLAIAAGMVGEAAPAP